MTKEERAEKWFEKVSGADQLSMEERINICDRVAKGTVVIFFVFLAGEFVILYLMGGGAAFEWLAERINRFSADSHGTRRYKSLAWLGVLLFLPYLVLPIAGGMIYKNKRLAALLKRACSESDKSEMEHNQVKIPSEPNDAGKPAKMENTIEKTYADWSMETDSTEQNGFTMKEAKRQLEAIKRGTTEFVIITPSEPIKVKETGDICSFVQVCQEEEPGYFHIEVSIANAIKSSNYVLYGKDRQSVEEVQELLCGLLESRIAPDFQDWDIVMDMRTKEENTAREEAAQLEDNVYPYKRIAELMAEDVDVLAKLKACIHSPRKYYHEHAEQYEDRGFEGDESEDRIRWIGLANEMISSGAAVELDWKTDREEFSGQMKDLAERHQLVLREDWLKEDGDIPEWCSVLDEKWAEVDACAAAIDIDSDSYVIFICKREVLERLKALGKKLNHRFDLAKNI
jgi:hypothetical protein